jgi:hypothetical protein
VRLPPSVENAQMRSQIPLDILYYKYKNNYCEEKHVFASYEEFLVFCVREFILARRAPHHHHGLIPSVYRTSRHLC